MKPCGALLAAPHRALFLSGSLAAVAAMLPWLLQLLGFAAMDAVAPMFAHAALMLFAVFPFFILGFVFTAGPRWLQVPGPARGRWLPAWALCSAGLALLLAGFAAARALAAAGAAVYLAGWLWGVAQHARHLRQSPATDRLHAAWVMLGFAGGAAALAALLAWLLSGDPVHWLAMRELALWGFLLPVYISVCHRMIPFFSANVLPGYQAFRPRWMLHALNGCCLLHLTLALAGLDGWTWIADLPLALLSALNVVRWGLPRSRAVPLLFVMHAAHVWLPLAAALYAAQSLAALNGIYPLGSAPAHALGIGFLSSMLLAFATRVTLGHSGRPLAWGRIAATAFWLLQALALLRVGFALRPSDAGLIAAALLWLLAFGLWCAAHVPIYLRPRADGQPG